MPWQEEEVEERRAPATLAVDVAFRIAGTTLPVEHAYSLSRALLEALPWLVDEPGAGIHQIHVAESGNGWMRPREHDDRPLCLSRRTRMTLRVPPHRAADAQELTGSTLDLDGYRLVVGDGTVKPLGPSSTLFSRYVAGEKEQPEEAFERDVVNALQGLGIEVKKLLCGRPHILRTPREPIYTRSVMIAALLAEDSLRLQYHGLGHRRTLGCGLFIPHKGIDPVRRESSSAGP